MRMIKVAALAMATSVMAVGCGTPMRAVAPMAPAAAPVTAASLSAEGLFDPDPRWAQTEIASEMKALGVKFRPKVVIDWTSYVDDGSQEIHISRFKFSKTFRNLAQKAMYDTTFIHLLRHETAHAFFNEKYGAGLKQQFKDAFGDIDKPYNVSLITQMLVGIRYQDRPEFVSKYAQVHPADDFAETFGVYLQKKGDPAKLDKFIASQDKNVGLKRKFDCIGAFFKTLRSKYPGEPMPAPQAAEPTAPAPIK
jgi:hypothetical protein